MNTRAILDSGALIVALQDECAQKHDAAEVAKHARHRAAVLMYLNTQKSPFTVPAVAFVEFLIGLPEQYKSYLSGLPRKFRVAALTDKIALITARLKTQLMDKGLKDKIDDDYGQYKNVIRGDLYILATCESEGKNNTLITRDGNLCKRAAKLGITCIHIEDLPQPPPPPKTLLDLEID